jgi:hypothetical protein
LNLEFWRSDFGTRGLVTWRFGEFGTKAIWEREILRVGDLPSL